MAGKVKNKIVWLTRAKEDFKQIIIYIKQDSPQNAQKVKTDVLSKISILSTHPERYPPDKFKLLNSDSKFRAFELIRSGFLIT